MKLISPLSVPLKKGKFDLNLNKYRNAHYRILAEAKIKFDMVMSEQVMKLPVMEKVELTYTVYFEDKRGRDIDNYCSIVGKFFSDCLVKAGKIPDDNFNYLQKITFLFGGIDKNYPRVEIDILEVF